MSITMKKFTKGVVLRGETSDVSENLEGSLFQNSSDARLKTYIEGAVRQVVTNSQAQVLTNKTIDVDNNTVSNIETDNLKTGVLNTDNSLSGATNTQIPSALAVRNYVDSSISGTGLTEFALSNLGPAITGSTTTNSIVDMAQSTNKQRIVAIGGTAGVANKVRLSSDYGSTFSAITVPQDNSFNGVAYGNGTFVAVSSNGVNQVMTSPLGTVWTMRTAAAVRAWSSVEFGNGIFVATCASGGTQQIMTSTDGITWTLRTHPTIYPYRVIFLNNEFIVTDANTTNIILKSSDGITWTAVTMPNVSVGDPFTCESIQYGNGIYILKGFGSNSGDDATYHSTDLISFTYISGESDVYYPAFIDGYFLIWYSVGQVYISSDGISRKNTAIYSANLGFTKNFVQIDTKNYYVALTIGGSTSIYKNLIRPV